MNPSLSLRAVADLLAQSFSRWIPSAGMAGLQRLNRLIQPARQGLLTAAVMLSLAGTAKAAGSSMPWEGPLQSILDSIQGPVARIVAVIIIIATGLALAFGDTSGGFRKLIQIVFGLSIAFAASSFFLSFFSFSGGALV
jgi:type IV secretory pathway VirB2 component (pilin)